MTTDIAVLERAVIVMAICMAIQTALMVGVAIAAFIAWRRTTTALAEVSARTEAQVAELRAYLDRMAGTVDDCIPVIDAFQEAGVDQLIIHMQMGNMPHERIMESIETLGTEVLPKYR